MPTVSTPVTFRLAEPADCARIGAFLEPLGGPYFPERFPGKTAADLYRWKFFSSPYGPSAVGLALAGDTIVSMASAMPKQMRFAGQLLRVYELGDFQTAESHRGQGLFSALIEQICAAAAERGGDLAYVRPNDLSFPILARRGFSEPQQIEERTLSLPGHSARLGPLAPVAHALGADTLLARWTLGQLADSSGVTVEPVREFPAETDALWEAAGAGYGVAIARTAEYLNWRFAHSPAPFELWIAHRAGTLVGVAVTFPTRSDRIGFLIDAFTAPNDEAAAAALVRHTVSHLLASGCKTVFCWTVLHGPDSALSKALRQVCFRRQSGPLHVAMRALRGGALPAVTGPWHLAMGDFDGF
jgi:GNAT superfamily N-acetyltransferase